MIDMNRLILGVAAALMLGAGQAAADGLPSRGEIRGSTEFAGAPAWTGLYLGAGIGGGVLQADTDAFGSGDGGSFFGTVVLGYDRQFGSGVVAGVFADIDFTNASADVGGDNVNQNFAWSIGGRVGGLVTPKTLLYATGGFTQADFDGLLNGTANGFFVGAGIEHVLRENWTVKFEYRFSDFQADVVDQQNNPAGGADLTTHTGRVVLSYKFPTRY